MAHTNLISIFLLLTCYPAHQLPTIDNQISSLNQFGNEELRYKSGADLRSKKDGMQNLQNELNLKWPTGKIYYYTNVSSYDHLIAFKLRMIMNMIETVSCLEFEALMVIPNTTSDINWIHFMNPRKERECVHNVDFSQKEIVVVMGYDCLSEVEVLHSLLHGIGFKDEVTHPLRDKYIRVLWSNIQSGYQNLYYPRYEDRTAALVEYDPLSVMHFADRDFSINGRATVEPVISGLTISPTRGLSQLDKLKLNLYFSYACNKREVKKILKTCKNTLHEEVDNKNKKDELEKSTDAKMKTFANVSKEKMSEESKNVLNGEADSDAEDGANNTTPPIVGGTSADMERSADSSAGEDGGVGADDIGLNSSVNKSTGVDSSAGADDGTSAGSNPDADGGTLLSGMVNKDSGEDSSAGVDRGTLLISMAHKGISGDDSADSGGGANDESNPGKDDSTPSSGMADKGASGDDSVVANDGASDENNPGADGGTLLGGIVNKEASGDDSADSGGGANDESNPGKDDSAPSSGMADKGVSGDDNVVADDGASDESNPGADGGTPLSGMVNRDPDAESSAVADGDTVLIGMADKGASGDDSASADGGTDKDEEKDSDSDAGTSTEGDHGADSEVDKTEGAASALRNSKYKKI